MVEIKSVSNQECEHEMKNVKMLKKTTIEKPVKRNLIILAIISGVLTKNVIQVLKKRKN